MSIRKTHSTPGTSLHLARLIRTGPIIMAAGLLIALSSPPAFGKGYEQYLDRFFSLWQQQEISQAIDALFASNEKWYSTDENLQELKAGMQELPGELGTYHGHERLDVYDYGTRIKVITHLLFFEESPLRMEFIFFKADQKWKIMHFSFAESLSEELLQDAREAISSRAEGN